jgi:hypothetical protein
MPSCKFFLDGLCTRGDDCPYRHVKVNEEASVCPDFLKGFCPAATECKKRHINACPQFETRGACGRGSACPLPHIAKKVVDAAEKAADGELAEGERKRKQKAPAKPKRKSIGEASTGKKQRMARYYEDTAAEEEEVTPSFIRLSDGDLVKDIVMENSDSSSSLLEAKRKRLMRKVELAKKGWTGVGAVRGECNDVDLDDSGPYEEIDEGNSEEEGDSSIVSTRPPLGRLPSFIPLSRDSDDDEEKKAEEKEIAQLSPIHDGKEGDEEYEERLI